MWTPRDLISAWHDLGLRGDGTVFVHSSLRRLGPVAGGADGMIDALLAAGGPDGTVAMPTHTWATVSSQQPVFHQRFSPSTVGTLTNVLRLRSGAFRSLHPTHSVAALGARARAFTADHALDPTPCAPGSPYGKLATWEGQILFLGVGLECCTFFHGCEEWAGCPWLFRPEPELYYCIDLEGVVHPYPARRHASAIPRCYPTLAAPLRALGALRGNDSMLLLDARPAADWLVAQLREDPLLVVGEWPDGSGER